MWTSRQSRNSQVDVRVGTRCSRGQRAEEVNTGGSGSLKGGHSLADINLEIGRYGQRALLKCQLFLRQAIEVALLHCRPD